MRRTAVLIVIGLLSGAAGARGDPWYVHYEKAERALAAEDWRTAVEQANEAIQRRGDSGARVRSYGMNVVDYFPYLKLGIAYQRLGENDAALQAFDTEERLGAVRASPEAGRELDRSRRLAMAARDQRSSTATAARRAQILEESLREARDLRERGLLGQAMTALARGLAIDPENVEAVALMADLRTRVAADEASAREDRLAAERLEAARNHLERGQPESAASLLRQVIAARPSEEASRLLERAQRAIVESLAAGRQSALLQSALADARRFAEAGRTPEALERLEVVLALAPGQAEATALRTRLTTALEGSRRSGALEDTLRAGEADFAAGRFEAALAAANRVLAVERGHPAALGMVRRAYVEISRRVLIEPSQGKIPPAIRFANPREEAAGELVERVRVPEFRLDGVAIDRSPVTVAFTDVQGRPIEGISSSQVVGEVVITEFHTRQRLKAGRTLFKVTATGASGLRSTSEFAVNYERPWYLSPWFYLAAVAVPGLGLGATTAIRGRRRRELRRRRFNPYIAGGPVFSAEHFYGREPLIQRILQTVHTNSLMLHGERRIGKTSLLHQVRQRLATLDDPEFQFNAIYIDLQGTVESRFFATLADQMFEGLAPTLGGLGRKPALGRAEGYDHHDLVRELHGLIAALQKASVKRVRLVLLIDEVDELNHYDPRVNQKLRSLFMKSFAESLVAVVAGVRIRKEWEKEGSPWYNFFEEIEVRPISADDARELVLRPIRGVFRVEPGVAERIVELGGYRPYRIQRLCLALVNRLYEEGRRTLTLADVAAVAAASDREGES